MKFTTLRPSWSVSVLIGATWKEPALVIAGPLVFGATAEIRLGQTPFMLGAWGTTRDAEFRRRPTARGCPLAIKSSLLVV